MVQRIARILVSATIALVAAAADPEIAGIWEGSENNLPAIELTLHVNDGKISGSIGFYFQSRGADGKWQLGEKYTVPLLSPKLEGRSLTFETIHHKCHDCPELGPNNKYQVDFVGDSEARIRILKDQKKQDGPSSKLTRRT